MIVYYEIHSQVIS